MSFKDLFSRSLSANPDRLHFAAHSHHLWPDASFDGHVQAWTDAARLADRKWDKVMDEVWPEAQTHVSRELGTGGPDSIVFSSNTHDFLVRLFAAAPRNDDRLRVLTTDGEFHSARRQLSRWEEEERIEVERIATEPFDSFSERFLAAARSGDHDLVLVSQVLFGSGRIFEPVEELAALGQAPGPWIVVDGYHAFMALDQPFGMAAARTAFYLAGGYKYAMSGEGCAFLHAPPGFGPRPPITGWYAEFEDLSLPPGRVGYAADARRFLGATFDPSALYRFNAVQRMLREHDLTTERISDHVAALQGRLLERLERTPLNQAELLNPLQGGPHARFLAFRSPDALRLHEELLAKNCVTDVRGDVLRLGFAIYQDEDDVDRLLDLLGGICLNDPARPQRSAPLVLALLLLAYIFNFLDRQILGILGPSIQADLHLSNAQFGAVGGTAFALLYSALGIPLAYLADRTSRSAVVAGSLAVWSAFTALCGAAMGYWSLFFCRLGVGVGEAGGVAPSYALIADYFAPQRRARALAIFSLGIPLGLGGGAFIGAHLAAWFGWRDAFVIMGVIGLVLAPILRSVVRDRSRHGAASAQVPLQTVFPILARKPAFWLIALASSASSLCGYGLALWTPKVMMLSFGLDLVSTGNFLASVLLIGGCAGVFAGGWLADRLGAADHGWYARLPAIAWIVSVPTWGFGLFAPSLSIAWPLLLVGNGVNILWLGPVITAVQHLVPRPMRATASASFLLINNLIGLGLGPWLIGRLSESLQSAYGANALRDAAVACLAFYVLAALLMLLSVRSLRSSWVADEDS